MPPKLSQLESSAQNKLVKEIADGEAALDESLKPLWQLIDKRFKIFEIDVKRDNVKLNELEVRMKNIESDVQNKKINIFKEMKDRQVREKNVILYNFNDSVGANNADL